MLLLLLVLLLGAGYSKSTKDQEKSRSKDNEGGSVDKRNYNLGVYASRGTRGARKKRRREGLRMNAA